ncbi:MAG: M48 family metalloprotease [Bacteroidota bacterium]|nr:M48 family metalloprotease [Bacteroidota bacterium]
MNQFSFLFSPAADALGHTLLYSFGQAFIVFICLRIVLKLIPNASAQIKYGLSYFGYLGVSAWFVVTLIRQFSIAKSVVLSQQIMANTSFSQVAVDHDSYATGSIFSLSFFNQYLPWVVGFYLVGILWYSIRLSLNFFQTNSLRTKGLSELDTEWQEHIINLANRMNIIRPLQTFFSRYVNTPMMIGFFKPVILLPLATMSQLSPQQFEAILIHELAHIRRNDYVLNILQSVLDTILFFNPFTWWITKNIREEREKSCDEMVLQLSDPYHYARALLALEEPLQHQPLVMTAVGNRSHLFHRIKNIMEMKNNRLNLRQKFITLVVIAIATISVAWLSPTENKAANSEKQNSVSEKNSAVSTPPFFAFFPFSWLKDSTPKGIIPAPPPPPPAPMPPVAMRHDGIAPMPPAPPVAPLPPMPGNSNMGPVPPPPPPMPPLPPKPIFGNDSLPPSADYFNSKKLKQQEEVIKKSTDEMRKYFQSDAWKKQQDLVRENAVAMKKYFSSPEWKKQQELIRNNAEEMKKYFSSPAWKNQQKLIQKNAEEMKKYFSSPEWKKQQELIQKNGEEMKKYFNSPEWKKQQQLIKKNAEKVKEYFNSPEWKKQQEEIRHATDSLSAYFKSDAWQKQQENIQQALAKTQQFFNTDVLKKVEENLQQIQLNQQKTQNDVDMKKK